MYIGISPEGIPTGAIPFSDSIYKSKLAATTEETMTVPDGKYSVIISNTAGKDVFYRLNSTVSVPSASAPSSTEAGELAAGVRQVQPGDVIHYISEEICNVTFSFYDKAN